MTASIWIFLNSGLWWEKAKKNWQVTQPSAPEDWSLISLYYIDASYLLTPPPKRPDVRNSGTKAAGRAMPLPGPVRTVPYLSPARAILQPSMQPDKVFEWEIRPPLDDIWLIPYQAITPGFQPQIVAHSTLHIYSNTYNHVRWMHWAPTGLWLIRFITDTLN